MSVRFCGSEHRQGPEKITSEFIIIATTSSVKIEPTRDDAKYIFEDATVQGAEAKSGVSSNPYGMETLVGALNRINFVMENSGCPGVTQFLAIESGVFPTREVDKDAAFIFRLSGRPTFENLEAQFSGGNTKFTRLKVNGQEVVSTDIVGLGETPLNFENLSVSPYDSGAIFYDRAVFISYDPNLNATHVCISRGVPFPNEAVAVAIGERGGTVRVSGVMLERLKLEGKIDDDKVILAGALKGRKFDVQDPQSYITGGQFSRVQQLSEIERIMFAKVKAERTAKGLY